MNAYSLLSARRVAYPGFLALLATAGGCIESASQLPKSTPPLPVTTVGAHAKSLALAIDVVGRTEGSKTVEIRARVYGTLSSQIYTEGAQVRSGEALFRIDASPFQIALARANAALAEAQATNEHAKRTAERMERLLGQNLVSRQLVEDARSALARSEAAQLAAQTDVREAELNLSYTVVLAPISGITGRAAQSEGSLLTPGESSSLLTTVTQTDPIWVRFALSQSEHAALRQARAARGSSAPTVMLLDEGRPAGPVGRINFAASSIDNATGTLQLRAEFSNPDLRILPGEYVQVRLVTGAREGIAIPQRSVLRNSLGAFVWIVDEQVRAQQRPVKTGAWIEDEWEIVQGLQSGDRVIIDNLLKLRPGQPVEPHPVPAAAPGAQNATARSTG